MKKNWTTKLLTGTLAVTMLAGTPVLAGDYTAAPDGHTQAEDLADSINKTTQWNKWKTEWNTLKNDWTQISLTPGSVASELNFAWYSKDTENGNVPKLKIGEGRKMANAVEYTAVQTKIDGVKDNDGNTYTSNKVTAVNLAENTTYYYQYQDGEGNYSEPVAYKTKDADAFSFVFVGDPQIGSSNPLKGKDSQEFYDAQSEAVRSDSFNWEATLNAAMRKTGYQAGFVVSAGDQIQTNQKKAPNKDAAKSEIEYTGYLSPDVLQSLPVATTVGNHDADNKNYTYHFNTPNNSTLGSNGIVGGDYSFTYGDALFIMLNTQDTNVAEHKQFIEQTVKANPDCKWKIVTLHQDIYGSAEHSNEPEITNLRYSLTPIFEANDIDAVLTGHDHAYSRSKMLLGGTKDASIANYTDDDFDASLGKDMDTKGDKDTQHTTAPGNITADSTDEADKAYLNYLNKVMDADAVEQVKTESDAVVNPDGILYMTASSSSGSKYYDLVPRMQTYIANRWQEDVPTYSVVDVTDTTFSIATYRTDTNEKIDDTFTITKVDVDKSGLETAIASAKKVVESSYTAASFKAFKQAIAGAEKVLADKKATNSEIQAAIKALTTSKTLLVKKVNVSTATVSKIASKEYTGKAIKPSITVKAGAKTLKNGTDYTVKYTSNTSIGKATVTITGKGNYTGTKKVTFSITPRKAILSSVKALGNKTVKTTYKKASGNVSGYVVVISNNSAFKHAKVITTKSTTCTYKAAKKNHYYYVKVKSYKSVSGKRIYGAYSKTVKVKVK